MAPMTTAPTATPIPAIAGAASPPSEEEATAVVGVSFGGGVGVMEGISVGMMGVTVGCFVEPREFWVKIGGMLPVENHASRYSRLIVDICVVESQ